ncbi:MAG: hydroxyethylthiazole kinase [Acidobacteriaceae bacterium]
MNDTKHLASAAAELLTRLRNRRPLIHHITNFVVMNTTANITLCAGALPVMAHARQEVEDMAASADALVLNLGTLWPEQVESMLLAGGRANAKGIPIVLDPVGAGATPYRTESAHRLLRELSVAIVRGNAAEVASLTGMDAGIRGVEAVGDTGDSAAIALAFARRYHCVAAVTGPVDAITDGQRLFRVLNGHPLMARVTGTGCMATSVIAAFATIEKDFTLASAAALACYGLAGEKAAERSQGPGSFQMHLFDTLADLGDDAVRTGARLQQQTL